MVDDPQTPINRRAENDGRCSASLDRNGPARSPFAVSRRPVIPSPRACLAVPSLDLSPSLPGGRGRRRWRDGVGMLRRASSLPRRPAPLEWVLPIIRGELSGKICSLGATFANPWGDDGSEGGAGCRGMRGRERVRRWQKGEERGEKEAREGEEASKDGSREPRSESGGLGDAVGAREGAGPEMGRPRATQTKRSRVSAESGRLSPNFSRIL